jgi:hypothetical protein
MLIQHGSVITDLSYNYTVEIIKIIKLFSTKKSYQIYKSVMDYLSLKNLIDRSKDDFKPASVCKIKLI